MDADCALFVNRLGADDRPDLMYHTYQLPFTFNTERLGYEVPDDRWCICMTPNIPRSHSKGRLFLLSKNPDDQAGARLPLLHRRRRLRRADDRRWPQARPRGGRSRPVRRLDRARDRARAPTSRATPTCPRTAAPCTTPSTTRPAPAAWARRTTIWPSSTPTCACAASTGLSIADGSIFPSMPTVNPVVATFMIGEKAADLVRGRNS